MAASLSSIIVLIITMAVSSIPQARADPRIDIVALLCTDNDVADGNMYTSYYNAAVAAMQHDMYRDKFAFKNFGNSTEKIYVLSQCMEDLSNPECISCFNQVSDFLSGCFPSTGGRVYLDGCFIRADNFSFSDNIVSADDMKRCGGHNSKSQEFKNLVVEVITHLVDWTPRNGGFRVYHKTFNDTTIFGMGSCLKTLDSQSCSACLTDGALSAMSCLPSTEGRALNAGCVLRYSDYKFYNDGGILAVEGAIISYISYILAAVAVSLTAVAVGFCVGKLTYRHKIRKHKGKRMDKSAIHKSSRFMQFKYSTLENATDNFSEVNKLGTGGYGEVYKGTLADGREIAIKRLFLSGNSSFEEVYNEMNVISQAQHKNLVRFLGCCFSKMNSFLVYEYLANRSLDRILFDPEKKNELDWKKRLVIILGTAQGLEYLHQDCQVRIVHRDIKASNILLDFKHRPKIADFGLARFSSSGKSVVSTAIAGTLGYMAPEYIAEGRLTDKIDVYSFGVLVLEIVSGLQNNKFQSENSLETLVIHTWKHFGSDTVTEIIDKSMEIVDGIDEVKRVIQVGLLCTQEAPYVRPTMTQVIQLIKQKDVKLPIPTRPPFIEEEESIDLSSCSSKRLQTSASDSLSIQHQDN